MAAPVGGNELARRVVDNLIDFNGQTFEVQTCRNQIAQLNALIAEMEAFDDPGEVFDTLMGLRDDVRGCCSVHVTLFSLRVHVDYCVWHVHFEELYAYVTAGSLAKIKGPQLFLFIYPFFILDKLYEVAESPRLVDKMKYVFGHSRGEDESFAGLMRDLCLSLRISLSKKRRLVAELEAVGEVEGVVKCLEHMRVIVARDDVTLGELEKLLGCAQVGVSLKAGFVADMEVKD
ncbi:hypothetical protein Tco_1346050 [Tanacetum coccineum]